MFTFADMWNGFVQEKHRIAIFKNKYKLHQNSSDKVWTSIKKIQYLVAKALWIAYHTLLP